MKRTPIKRKTPLKAKAPMKKSSRPKMTPIRRSARGQECQVRIPGFCNGDSSTTVLAHLNGGGMGAKASDHEAAYACSACHAWLDGGYTNDMYTRDDRDLFHLQAVIRTQRILIEQGLMEVAA
ncbi:DUF1364 domain-containing protein [Marinobacter sp. 71-i]|uniref:DUF1364 domain-containing protein n=1 Tax=Marinobacter iranensis TaxID=2962607 RepID=A0ABT5Y9G1_9GAMM|nr:nuclease domain-containing protein [Marinobacter iranensis]MDF0750305.1 DUF1364 domain-containing protein [Marinobacter iranensis]